MKIQPFLFSYPKFKNTMKLFDRKHQENTKQNMYPVAGGQINYGIQDMPFLVFLDALSRS